MAKTGKNAVQGRRPVDLAAGGSGGRCAASGARPVDLAASGAANFPEKLTGGQRPAGRGRFQAGDGRQAAA